MAAAWTARSGDVELHVTEAGPRTGSPVLLLHGFPDSAALWRHQVGALAAAGHRVLAPDLRGFGASTRPADVGAYAMPHLVADVAAVLDAAGAPRAAVVGHDWGAVLAWAFTRAAPERVERLVAVSVGHPRATAAGGLQQALRSWYIYLFLLPGVAERVVPAADWAFVRRLFWGGASPADEPDLARQLADLARPGALAAGLAWYRANLRPTRLPRGGGGRSAVTGDPVVRCPVMGVWSSADPALTEAQMLASQRFVAGPWRYERLDGVDHWVPVHAAARLSALLVAFLADDRLADDRLAEGRPA
ncbi:MAG: hypothetical protein AVDCRST_MAG35-113 [uncultured Quadrisphaera sp.]|uniref:AB hydrolase-1 domain-containing protein n=1 Tax=uncultured Quadrisphaera sp. TaxID=904978 RepID=A0A6J4NI23_9ACTN|nr:MAG: hypothetical protein AVDCRST_MAG35-113 [uncultured Quadrisphaera sp.]